MSMKVRARGKTSLYNKKGNCVIPIEIRDHLNLEKGDEVMFMENEDGDVEVFKIEEE